MKYRDLIQFEPIESVIKLREADRSAEARRLVETFVISDRMAENLIELVLPQLQFNLPADNKGLLVVGNYGTGKSHLMAVISAIAEHEDLAAALKHPEVTTASKSVAGQFKVIRAEIGSTTMPLRSIMCEVLENGLAQMNVDFAFPDISERHENKTAFMEMMAAFQEVFPDHGLLLVVDELLDYLRSRKDQELSLDLSFLREVGEVCKGTRFRFISGVQESLFDNPRFQFVADTLRRVKDRFEQLRIAREDISHVVAERLLKKDPKQQALVREHLTSFGPLYGNLNERMEDFVRLYPVHPAFIDTFEKVYIAEKREVLRTLSRAINRVLDQEVPTDEPGVFSYDTYWQTLKDNSSFRAIPEIREVIDKSDVLEGRIQQAFTQPLYKPMALRIIHALSIHRLTTADIFSPLGATAEELRDDLFLLLQVPVKEAGFLAAMVGKVLQEIIKTVSGQFLTHNKENGQYYLDLKKDVDYDSLILKKAESLDESQLDRYYFDALRRVVLEDPEAPAYVGGYRIWSHEVEWLERKAGRAGYLFFGAPNERSTAQPPRDFYLYFIQPHDAPAFKDDRKADEVFFRLAEPDDDFTAALRLYAGAQELAASASGSNRKVYQDKAGDQLRTLTKWLREHILTAFEVTFQGKSRRLKEVIQGKVPGGLAKATVRDLINLAGSLNLGSHFADQAPEYPTFSVSITGNNREQAAQDALKWIGGSVKSKLGAAVLDALKLLDGDTLRPADSDYAAEVVGQLEHKGAGQVLNRSELVQSDYGIEYWSRFRMEPELLAVVLAALVHSGDLVLSLPGKKLDASNLDQLARLPLADVKNFKHVERPKDFPLAALKALFELLELPQGLIVNPASREEAVAQLGKRSQELVSRVLQAHTKLPDLLFWSQPVLSSSEQAEWRKQLQSAKTFLESLQPYNSVGKLKNFRYSVAEIEAQAPNLRREREVATLVEAYQNLRPFTAYLGQAEAVLAADHPWVAEVREARADLQTQVQNPATRASQSLHRQIETRLRALMEAYHKAYLAAHQRARLNASEDKKKASLCHDARLKQLRKLKSIQMMPTQQLADFENQLLGLKTCYHLTAQELSAEPICKHCHYRPVEEPRQPASLGDVLDALDARLDRYVQEWTESLLSLLSDPTVTASIQLLSDPAGRAAIESFLERRSLPEPIDATFLKAVQEVLSGLEEVKLYHHELIHALTKGGLPCTVDELKQRWLSLVGGLTKGKDMSRARIVIEAKEPE